MNNRTLFLFFCSLSAAGWSDQETNLTFSAGYRQGSVKRTIIDFPTPTPPSTTSVPPSESAKVTPVWERPDVRSFITTRSRPVRDGEREVELANPLYGVFTHNMILLHQAFIHGAAQSNRIFVNKAVRNIEIDFYMRNYSELQPLVQGFIDSGNDGLGISGGNPHQLIAFLNNHGYALPPNGDGNGIHPHEVVDLAFIQRWFAEGGINLAPPAAGVAAAVESEAAAEAQKREYEQQLEQLKYLQLKMQLETLFENNFALRAATSYDIPVGKGVIKRKGPSIVAGEFQEEKIKPKGRWNFAADMGYAFRSGENRFIPQVGICGRHQNRSFEAYESVQNPKEFNYGSWEWGPYAGFRTLLSPASSSVVFAFEANYVHLFQDLPQVYGGKSMGKNGFQLGTEMRIPCGDTSFFLLGGEFEHFSGTKKKDEDSLKRRDQNWTLRLGWGMEF